MVELSGDGELAVRLSSTNHAAMVRMSGSGRLTVSAGLAAQRVDEQAPMFGAVGRFIRANEGLIALVALVVAVLALLSDRVSAEQPDPPASATVQVQSPDRAEVERIVEEHLREQEQQRDGYGDHRSG